MKNWIKTIIVVCVVLLSASCVKEHENSTGSKLLLFSQDTITFDTLFTSISSTTKNLRVINPTDGKMFISSVRLMGGENSGFRLNINGEAVNKAFNIEIPAHDSIFIFIEARLKQQGEKLSFVSEDSILFLANNREQKVMLIAWGKEYHLIKSDILKTTTWTKEKPYLVYNYVYVDTCQTLTIEKGTTIYFHENSGLYVKGKVIINGTLEEPVVLKGDRLESGYANLADQWNGITLLSGSHDNFINYAIIKNANIGLQVGTIEIEGFATVELANTKIENMSWSGIWAMKSKILAYNCIISNVRYYNTALLLGGDYRFYHTTFVNYNNDVVGGVRSTETLIISNYLVNQKNGAKYIGDMRQAAFENCIISGKNRSELKVSMDQQGKSNYLFNHCLIQVADTFNMQQSNRYIDIIRNVDPKFVQPLKGNFELDSLSVARNAGSIAISKNYPKDIKGEDRLIDKAPDLGAFEKIERKSIKR